MAAQRQALFHGEQNFADAEEADDRDEEIDAAQKIVEAECHAELAGNRIHADPGEQQPERHRDHDLVALFLAETDERTEGQKIDGEKFRRPEAKREIRDPRREKRNQHHRDERADERRREGGRQRFRGFSLLRHRIAVEGGRDRPGLARNVEQNRRDGAAEQRAPINTGQHHDRGCRVHRKGQRQQNRDAVRSAEARQHADEYAEHEPEHHQEQFVEGQKNFEPMQQETKCFHDEPQ